MGKEWDEFGGMFAGTTSIEGSAHTLTLIGFDKFCYEQWRDLPESAQMVVLPREDFDVLIKQLARTPYLTIRDCAVISVTREKADTEGAIIDRIRELRKRVPLNLPKRRRWWPLKG